MSAKVYKATPAAVSRFLSDKGFTRSVAHPTGLGYMKNHSRGFHAQKAYNRSDEAVYVSFYTAGTTTSTASMAELAKVLEALEERFAVVHDVAPNYDRLVVVARNRG